jgi:hypothetical protein
VPHEHDRHSHLYEVEHERMLEHRLEQQLDEAHARKPSPLVHWLGTWGYYFGILLGMIAATPLWSRGFRTAFYALLPIWLSVAIAALALVLIGLFCRIRVYRYEEVEP